MTRLERWLRFNGVGVMGAALQLALVAWLHRLLSPHYLLATLCALELTLLHNFAWHRRWTWSDKHGSWPQALLRFHASNGLVSGVGNLVLMRVLVGTAHWPAVAANAVAILACSLANFAFSELWVFASSERLAARRQSEVSC